jgi:hypothetical protein
LKTIPLLYLKARISDMGILADSPEGKALKADFFDIAAA